MARPAQTLLREGLHGRRAICRLPGKLQRPWADARDVGQIGDAQRFGSIGAHEIHRPAKIARRHRSPLFLKELGHVVGLQPQKVLDELMFA